MLIEDGNTGQRARSKNQIVAHIMHVQNELDRMVPILHQTAAYLALKSLLHYHESINSPNTTTILFFFNDCNQKRDHDLPTASSNGDLGLREKPKVVKCTDLTRVCQTERLHEDDLGEVQTVALGFNANSSNTKIVRWTRGSTLYYYIDHRGLSTAQTIVIQAGLKTAANHWHATGLRITFEETNKWQEATFTIAYNPDLGLDHYALAFFPGWQRRVIDIGDRLLVELQCAAEVFRHELGHVLGLRHEFWEDNNEPGNAYQYPSDAHDEDSIMNDRNVGDMSLFTISPADEDAIRRFYDLRPGQHSDIFIQDFVPRPAVEYLGLFPAQITQTGGCAPAIRRQSVP